MDKKTLTGFVIIGLILLGYSWYGQQEAEKQREAQQKVDSVSMVEQSRASEIQKAQQTALLSPEESAKQMEEERLRQEEIFGKTLLEAKTGDEQLLTLKNNRINLTISNRGGAIVGARVEGYTTYAGEPLELFRREDAVFNLSFYTNQYIQTQDFFFKPMNEGTRLSAMNEGEEQTAEYRLYFDSTAYVQYLYTLKYDDNMVGFKVNLVGMERYMQPSQGSLDIAWSNIAPQQERGFEYENQYTTVAYRYPGESSVEELSFSKESKQEDIKTRVQWIAFKQQFFSSIFVSEDGFENGEVGFDTFKPGSGDIKHFFAKLSVPYAPDTKGYNFSFYFGPNDYTDMKAYDMEFQKLIPLGWALFRWISIYVIIPTFNVLGSFITNYGLIIFLLTIFIKLLIFPFTYKSYLSMAKMRLIKPEMDALNEKYPKKEDAMKKQQAMMALYKSAGVNPMGGCLPLLLQMPIIIAMFRFFPASIELRQASFLWADDLSSYDSILQLPFNIPFYGDHVSLFAILMAVSMYAASKINMQNTASTSQLPGMNFMMLYIMPLMLMVWFNNYSSGLCYYYFLANIITILQTILIRRVVNEEKMHARMKENAKKPQKKSAFQRKLEEMAKQQEALKKQQRR